MKVLILIGSAKSKGTSTLLAEEYQRGAEEVGHVVEIFRAGTGNVHGCTGCNHCEYGRNSCAFRDDMDALNPKLLEADVIVIASPIYYWGFLRSSRQSSTAGNRPYLLCRGIRKSYC